MKALLGKNFPDLRKYHMEVAPKKRNLEVENTIRQVENSETCITLVNLWVKFPPLWQPKVKRQTANRHAESSVRR
jgi:hypothetical protein